MSVLLVMDIVFIYDLTVNHVTEKDHGASDGKVTQSKLLDIINALFPVHHLHLIFSHHINSYYEIHT